LQKKRLTESNRTKGGGCQKVEIRKTVCIWTILDKGSNVKDKGWDGNEHKESKIADELLDEFEVEENTSAEFGEFRVLT